MKKLHPLFALVGLTLISGTAGAVLSSPDLGKAEGQCRASETGPALLIGVGGLKDRAGRLKLEVYPSNDTDFLQDDNILINEGKTFRRVEVSIPQSGAIELCIRIPGPGVYSVSLLHDRDANRKFSLSTDGIGFTGNPKLGWSKPKAVPTRINAGGGVTRSTIIMNYRTGLMSFGPLKTGK
jgi:uncharacterized protein (DUF2141 family)